MSNQHEPGRGPSGDAATLASGAGFGSVETREPVARAGSAVVTMDERGLVTGWGVRAESMFGWSCNDVMGRPLADCIIPARHREAHNRGLARYRASGGAAILDRVITLSAVDHAGREFPVETAISSAARNHGNTSFVAHMTDISERRQSAAEGRRVAAETRLQNQISANMTEGVVLITARDGRVAHANAAFETMFGYDPDEVTGLPIAAVLSPGDMTAEQAARRITEVLTTQGAWSGDVRSRRKDGTIFWCHVNSCTFEDAEYETVWIGIYADITESKRSATLIGMALDRAESAGHSKNQHLARISHELRTPLATIRGFTEVLQMTDPRSDQRESIATVLRAADQLLVLVNQVLDISGMDAGGDVLSIQPLEIEGLVVECCDLASGIARRRRISLEPDLEGTSGQCILADRQRFKDVILNLLSNAINYTQEEGSVVVSVRFAAGDRLRVGVTDTGPGIPDYRVPLLFEAFERLGAEQTTVKGTGLGLAWSRAQVEAMGGEMGVETRLGRGSTFWLELPRNGAVRS